MSDKASRLEQLRKELALAERDAKQAADVAAKEAAVAEKTASMAEREVTRFGLGDDRSRLGATEKELGDQRPAADPGTEAGRTRDVEQARESALRAEEGVT